MPIGLRTQTQASERRSLSDNEFLFQVLSAPPCSQACPCCYLKIKLLFNYFQQTDRTKQNCYYITVRLDCLPTVTLRPASVSLKPRCLGLHDGDKVYYRLSLIAATERKLQRSTRDRLLLGFLSLKKGKGRKFFFYDSKSFQWKWMIKTHGGHRTTRLFQVAPVLEMHRC